MYASRLARELIGHLDVIDLSSLSHDETVYLIGYLRFFIWAINLLIAVIRRIPSGLYDDNLGLQSLHGLTNVLIVLNNQLITTCTFLETSIGLAPSFTQQPPIPQY